MDGDWSSSWCAVVPKVDNDPELCSVSEGETPPAAVASRWETCECGETGSCICEMVLIKCAGVDARVCGIDGELLANDVRLTTLASLDPRAELLRVEESYGLLRFFDWPESFDCLRFDGAVASATTGSIACPNCDQSISDSGIPFIVGTCLFALTVL